MFLSRQIINLINYKKGANERMTTAEKILPRPSKIIIKNIIIQKPL